MKIILKALLLAHSRQEGLHNIEKLLAETDADYWEIHMLHPKAFRG